MHTRDFAAALERLIDGTQARTIHTIIRKNLAAPGSTPVESDDKSAFARAVFGIQAYLANLDAVEARLAKELGLNTLLNQTELAKVLTAFQNAANHGAVRGDHSFWDLSHALESLIRLQSTVQKELIAPKGPHESGNAVFTLDVVDYENDGVAVLRLSRILATLNDLYSAVDHALGSSSTARVAYLDSGSDIKIGLEGVKETIDAVANMFGRAWDAVRFHRNDRLERDIQTAIQAVDFLSSLKARQDQGHIDAQTALAVEAGVKQKMIALIGAGVVGEGAEEIVRHDRRAVLQAVRDQRLLSSGTRSDPNDADQS